MVMEPETKPRRIRLISGPPEIVDAQVNELLDDYALISLNYSTARERPIVTAYLVLQSELRKMQLANIKAPNMVRG